MTEGYWNQLSNRDFVWNTDRGFRMFIHKKNDSDNNSWRVTISMRGELSLDVDYNLSYREALRAIRNYANKYPRTIPQELFKAHFSESELTRKGFFKTQIVIEELEKIAEGILQSKSGLTGGRYAPIKDDDGTITFSFFAGNADMALCDRIRGVVSVNGYELIDYNFFGAGGLHSVYLKMKIKKREEKN